MNDEIAALVPVTEQSRLKSGLKDDMPVAQNSHSLICTKAQTP